MLSVSDKPQCTCGHRHEAHQHYRRGSDCGLCDCARYRRGTVTTPDESSARAGGAHGGDRGSDASVRPGAR
jgi:hypothetical protein